MRRSLGLRSSSGPASGNRRCRRRRTRGHSPVKRVAVHTADENFARKKSTASSARPHELAATLKPPAHHPGCAVGHPDRVELTGCQQPRQRPRVEAVGLRPRLAHPGCRSGRRPAPRPRAARSAACSQALPVTSSATRSAAPRLCTNSSSCSGLVSIRRAERTSPSSAIATSQNSRWTSNPIARACSSFRSLGGRTDGQTTSTHSRSQRNRTSRRGGHRKARAPTRPSSSKNRPAQPRSPEGPCPTPPTISPDPDVSPQGAFHAAKRSGAV